jgi:hypothetical protein
LQRLAQSIIIAMWSFLAATSGTPKTIRAGPAAVQVRYINLISGNAHQDEQNCLHNREYDCRRRQRRFLKLLVGFHAPLRQQIGKCAGAQRDGEEDDQRFPPDVLYGVHNLSQLS